MDPSPRPPALRPDGAALLVRTDFTDQPAWDRLIEGVRTPSPEDFLATVEVVDDAGHRDLTPSGLRALFPERVDGPHLFFVADHRAVTAPGHPLLVVALPYRTPGFEFLNDVPRPAFRVAVAALWSVENNLSLANLDWSDFTRYRDDDGVFRGFRPAG